MSGPTVDELEAGIVAALHDRNFEAAVEMLRALAFVDPHRAGVVYDTMLLGLQIARVPS